MFPWTSLIPIGSQLFGMWFGGKKAKQAEANAMQRSPEELAALKGASGVAGTAAKTAGSLITQSRPYIQQPANYYQTLLSGNRAAMSGATAAPMAALTGQYRGAERGLERSGVRGAARDYASGELNRQRASQMSALTTGVQPGAAAALSTLGTNVLQSATPLYATAGNIYSGLLGEAGRHRQWATQQGTAAGTAWGDLIRTLGQSVYDIFNKDKKPSTTPQTSTPTRAGTSQDEDLEYPQTPPEQRAGTQPRPPTPETPAATPPYGPGRYPPWFPQPGGGATIPPIWIGGNPRRR